MILIGPEESLTTVKLVAPPLATPRLPETLVRTVRDLCEKNGHIRGSVYSPEPLQMEQPAPPIFSVFPLRA